MNCLTDYIGLKGCSNAEPLSGLFINDYPGMSSELLDKVATPDQVSYVGMWESVQKVAYQRIRRDIQAALFTSAEVINAVGPLETLRRLKSQSALPSSRN